VYWALALAILINYCVAYSHAFIFEFLKPPFTLLIFPFSAGIYPAALEAVEGYLQTLKNDHTACRK